MSTNDILRKYLDILSEDEAKPASADAPASAPESNIDSSSLSSLTYAPPKGKGSINAVKTAVGDFQESIGMKRTGVLDPKTLAEILSQSGTIGKDEAEKLDAGSEEQQPEEKTAMAESAGTSKQQQLMEKACLHEGYAHGLMGHEHRCAHSVGTSEHSHYCHGHQLGLKECGGTWTRQAPPATF